MSVRELAKVGKLASLSGRTAYGTHRPIFNV